MDERTTKIVAIQKILDPSGITVKADGIAGPITRGAVNELFTPNEVWHVGKASSFADPKDVEAFNKYYDKFIKQGMSMGKAAKEAFKYGDNGRGLWDDDTTGATPCCALTPEDIVKRWGTVPDGKHKLVQVVANDTSVIAVLKDIKGNMNEAIIDLNPGACAALGWEPPVMASCKWKWVS